ncbi:hypothetical protein [Gordonia polyisoprenivorans]|uniref:hypothetical protein n=1 Tax=Gordonia polyisoprenivorans TaxID=84595 RepID=UPI001AD64DC2|nr:hypothetical protein [Gordonia polyisoprenivorans]QTI69765.1 hypothetical protein J6U32_03915 [Gordonia polyisoprenivorans]
MGATGSGVGVRTLIGDGQRAGRGASAGVCRHYGDDPIVFEVERDINPWAHRPIRPMPMLPHLSISGAGELDRIDPTERSAADILDLPDHWRR